jgi:hypothetical protein
MKMCKIINSKLKKINNKLNNKSNKIKSKIKLCNLSDNLNRQVTQKLINLHLLI